MIKKGLAKKGGAFRKRVKREDKAGVSRKKGENS